MQTSQPVIKTEFLKLISQSAIPGLETVDKVSQGVDWTGLGSPFVVFGSRARVVSGV